MTLNVGISLEPGREVQAFIGVGPFHGLTEFSTNPNTSRSCTVDSKLPPRSRSTV